MLSIRCTKQKPVITVDIEALESSAKFETYKDPSEVVDFIFHYVAQPSRKLKCPHQSTHTFGAKRYLERALYQRNYPVFGVKFKYFYRPGGIASHS